MKSLRDYLDIIQQLEERITINPDGTTSGGLARPPAPAAAPAAGPASPWANDPAKDAAWKALTPEDQKWLGGADPTDKFILMRAPKKGAPAPAAAPAAAPAPAPAATGATMDDSDDVYAKPFVPPTAAAPTMSAADQEDADQGAAMTANAQAANPTMTAADQEDADMGKAMAANTQAANGVNTAGQNVTMPDGTNPETGEKTTTTTAAAPAPTAGQGASPAAPANRDAMPFGKAFADAKAKGESQFTWKGKPYAVQLAKPAAPARDPKGAYRGDRTEVTPPAPYNAAKDSQKANVGQAAALTAPNQSSAETARLARQKPAPAATPAQIAARTFESVGFQDDELSRIVSLVHHR